MKETLKHIGIAVGFVLVATIIGLILAVTLAGRKKEIVLVPVEVNNISSTVKSHKDGSEHHVELNLYLELSESLAGMVSPRTLRKQLNEMIGTLDYDQLTGINNTQYVKEFISSQFSSEINPDEIGGVYITDIVTGPFKFYNPNKKEEEPEKVLDIKTQQKFNGLFKNSIY